MSIIQEHYNIDKLLEVDANIYLIVGEKSNGKSFQAKNKCMIDNYIQNKKRFVLTRRWDTDMTNSWVSQYFADVDVASKTKNKYTAIVPYKQAIYFGIFDEKKGRIKPIEKIGYIIPLSMEQHYSSGSYLDVDTIVFEEFMERGVYGKNEPDKLMAMYSTIDRKRGTTKLILVGNTISRVCPYLKAWELDKVFRKMKPRRHRSNYSS